MNAWVQDGTPYVDRGCLVAEEIDSQASASERVLLWLLQHPFQSIEDIALDLGWHRASIYRQMTKLKKQGQIETIPDPYSTTKACTLYLLSRLGITAVAEMLDIDVNSLMAHWRYQERGLLAWLPCLSTQRVLQHVINSLVRQWVHTNCSRTRVTWKWIYDYCPTSMPIMERQKSIADALVIFSLSDQTMLSAMQSQTVYQSLLLVIDPGFAGERDRDLIRQRVEALRLFYEALEPGRGYPPALIVSPSQENSMIWADLFHEIAKGQAPGLCSGVIETCTYDELLLAHHRVPWEQISDGSSCDPMRMLSSSVHREPPPMRPLSGSNVKSVLRGHLMERSRMDRGSNHSEREVLGLLALRLHRRHLNVLQMVYQHPLLSREEIAEVLHFENDSVRHTLSELVRWNCVNVYHLPCGQRFSLGPYGIRFKAALLQVAPVMITEIYQGSDQRILQHGRRVSRGLIAQIKQLLPVAQMKCQ